MATPNNDPARLAYDLYRLGEHDIPYLAARLGMSESEVRALTRELRRTQQQSAIATNPYLVAIAVRGAVKV